MDKSISGYSEAKPFVRNSTVSYNSEFRFEEGYLVNGVKHGEWRTYVFKCKVANQDFRTCERSNVICIEVNYYVKGLKDEKNRISFTDDGDIMSDYTSWFK